MNRSVLKKRGFLKTSFKLCVVFLFLCQCVNAQQDPGRLNLPTVIPPSPAAQNFLRYGEIPVDYSTGVPNISIPLYTAKSRQLSLPISISYHGSGIKVEDKASVVGLGWVLNAGGMITETQLYNVGGTPLYNTAEALNAARLTTLTSTNRLDAQNFAQTMYNQGPQNCVSNRFNFSLPDGESGTFRYDYITGNVVKLPYSPVKISPSNNGGGGTAPGGPYTITDTKGVSYTFTTPIGGAGQSPTSTLSSMISADKTDTIRFVYKSTLNQYFTPAHTSALQEYEYPFATGVFGGVAWQTAISSSNTIGPTGYYTYEQVLDSVITANTVITFTSANDRADLLGTGSRLTNMKIYNRQTSALIKSFDFNQDYFGSSAHNNQRLKLTGITARDASGTAIENHTFDYETLELPPYPENITGANKYAEDYWGYYNGLPAASKVPAQFTPKVVANYHSNSPITVSADNYTIRDPDSAYAKAAMLKAIHYPTGGKTVFTFEANQAGNAYLYPTGVTVPTIVGGFRIKKISNYGSDGTLTDYKSYTYSQGTTRTIENDLFAQTQRTFVVVDIGGGISANTFFDYPNLIISSDSFLPLTCDNGPPVLYTSISEYIGDASGSNAGKTVYSYDTPPTTYNTHAGYDDPQYTGNYFYDRGNYVPVLLDKKTYKNNSDGTYLPLTATHSTYLPFLSDTSYYMGYRVVNMNSYPTGSIFYDTDQLNTGGYYNANYCCTTTGYNGYATSADLFIAEDVYATQTQNMLTQSIQYEFNPSDSTKYVATTTSYLYGQLSGYTYGTPAGLQPTQKTVSSSTGDNFITQYEYPFENSSTAPYSTMLSRNILSPVIKQSNFKNSTSTFLNRQITNYNAFTTDIIAPQTVQTQQGSGSVETRITYNAYDNKANVATVSKAGGPSVGYHWAYKQTYPVAQATNAANDEFFTENFEESSLSGIVTTGTAHTGHNYYNGSYTTSDKLTPGYHSRSYLISYWSNSGSGWVYTAPVAYTGQTLTGNIDDVRIYPADAQVSTYTYDPLIGMTSTIDPKGETSYYEYDNFLRLMNVKDKDGNIIKHMDYHYKN